MKAELGRSNRLAEEVLQGLLRRVGQVPRALRRFVVGGLHVCACPQADVREVSGASWQFALAVQGKRGRTWPGG